MGVYIEDQLILELKDLMSKKIRIFIAAYVSNSPNHAKEIRQNNKVLLKYLQRSGYFREERYIGQCPCIDDLIIIFREVGDCNEILHLLGLYRRDLYCNKNLAINSTEKLTKLIGEIDDFMLCHPKIRDDNEDNIDIIFDDIVNTLTNIKHYLKHADYKS